MNQNLVLIVDELRMRQEGLTRETSKLERKISEQEEIKRRFKEDLFTTLNCNQNEKMLKKGIIRLYRAWVLEEKQFSRGQTDPLSKYANERRQLENSVKTLEDKLEKDTKKHSDSNKRVLKENV